MARPFADLASALHAAAGRRVVAVAAGRYRLDQTLTVSADQAGLTLIACDKDQPVIEAGPGLSGPLLAVHGTTAVRIAGLSFQGTGQGQTGLELTGTACAVIANNHFAALGTAIVLAGALRNRIAGNRIESMGFSGIEAKDGSNNNVIDDNTIVGIHGQETHGGGIFLHGASNNQVSHNLIRGADGMGIGISNWDDTTVNAANVVDWNRVEDVNRQATDSGAIYFLGRSRIDTRSVIADNVIDGTGRPDQHSVGIYLDDSINGVTVQRNIVRHPGSDATQIHGGSSNTIENNVLDLSHSRASAVLFQAAPADTHPDNLQQNNVVRHNLIIDGGPSHPIYFWIDGGHPDIFANVYVDVPRTAMPDDSPARDRAPVFLDATPADAAASNYAAFQRRATRAVHFAPLNPQAAGPQVRSDYHAVRSCSAAD